MDRVLLIENKSGAKAFFSKKPFFFEVDTITNLKDFESMKSLSKYNMIIMDSSLDIKHSELIVKRMEKISSLAIPLICYGSNSDIEKRVQLFALGIKDYIDHKMDIREVFYRINNLRKNNLSVSFGNLTLDPIRDEVHVERSKIDLTQIEYKILHFIISNSKAVSSSDIIQAVWKKSEVDIKTFNTHFSNLNKKLSPWDFRLFRVRNKYIKIVPTANNSN